jgi:hypothetical protein
MKERDDLIEFIQRFGGNAGHAIALPGLINAFEAAVRADQSRKDAEKIRAWGSDGALRQAEDVSPFYLWEDADRAADLIDPDKES